MQLLWYTVCAVPLAFVCGLPLSVVAKNNIDQRFDALENRILQLEAAYASQTYTETDHTILPLTLDVSLLYQDSISFSDLLQVQQAWQLQHNITATAALRKRFAQHPSHLVAGDDRGTLYIMSLSQTASAQDVVTGCAEAVSAVAGDCTFNSWCYVAAACGGDILLYNVSLFGSTSEGGYDVSLQHKWQIAARSNIQSCQGETKMAPAGAPGPQWVPLRLAFARTSSHWLVTAVLQQQKVGESDSGASKVTSGSGGAPGSKESCEVNESSAVGNRYKAQWPTLQDAPFAAVTWYTNGTLRQVGPLGARPLHVSGQQRGATLDGWTDNGTFLYSPLLPQEIAPARESGCQDLPEKSLVSVCPDQGIQSRYFAVDTKGQLLTLVMRSKRLELPCKVLYTQQLLWPQQDNTDMTACAELSELQPGKPSEDTAAESQDNIHSKSRILCPPGNILLVVHPSCGVLVYNTTSKRAQGAPQGPLLMPGTPAKGVNAAHRPEFLLHVPPHLNVPQVQVRTALQNRLLTDAWSHGRHVMVTFGPVLLLLSLHDSLVGTMKSQRTWPGKPVFFLAVALVVLYNMYKHKQKGTADPERLERLINRLSHGRSQRSFGQPWDEDNPNASPGDKGEGFEAFEGFEGGSDALQRFIAAPKNSLEGPLGGPGARVGSDSRGLVGRRRRPLPADRPDSLW